MKGVSSVLQAQIINQTLREEKKQKQTVMEDWGGKTNKKPRTLTHPSC